MKKASFISILALLSISGCTLDDAIELGFDCPPRMFAYDVDSGQAPYLCMLDDNDINDAGIPNCVPCDFQMNRIADDERIVLAKNNNGNYIYSNADADEENVNRKYLSEKAKGYIVYKYSTYVSYLENLEPDDNNQKIASLYAISGFCTRTDLERYDECNVLCSDESESCDASCKKVISNASKCFMIKGYSTFFDHNICPAEYPICSFGQYDAKGNNFYCSFNNVGECDPETVNIDCANRITHWQNGECQNNICVVTECSEGYQAANDGKSCVADCKSGQHYDSSVQKCVVDDIDNCGLTGKTCASIIPQWVAGTCEAGVCKVSECSAGFKPAQEQLSCVSNCDVGMHYDEDVQNCVDDDIENCGSKGKSCASMISQWVDGACEDGVCKVSECSTGFKPAFDQLSCASDCQTGQHYDNNDQRCVDDDLNNCGATGKSCAASVTQWVAGICEAGVCKVSECAEGFMPAFDQLSCASDCQSGQHYDNSAQKCVDDDVDNCGAADKHCSDIVPQWVGGSCEAGVCKVSECVDGFIPTGDGLSCVSDCPGGTRCKSNDQIVCIDPMTNNSFCGADSDCQNYSTCVEGEMCINGTCTLKYCTDGVSVICTTSQPPACINIKASDAQNCGSCGYDCSKHPQNHASSNTCSSGDCLYECESGYTNCGEAKVPNCILNANFQTDSNNCGGCGTQCSTQDEYCKNGKCVKSSCKDSCQYNDECVNTNDHCGTSCTNCGSLPYVASSQCVSGSCKIDTCTSNAHLYNNTCELDSLSNCGSHDYTCSEKIAN